MPVFALLNLALSWALLSLIWVTQLVTYPGFKYADADTFREFHLQYTWAITYVVMPLMLSELGLSLWMVFKFNYSIYFIAILLIVLAIWASTFFIQVPLHNTLSSGKDEQIIQKLVQTNWIRTALWTAKAALVTYLYIKG